MEALAVQQFRWELTNPRRSRKPDEIPHAKSLLGRLQQGPWTRFASEMGPN